MDGAGNPDLAPREPPGTSATPGEKPAHRPPPPPAGNPYPTWRLTLIYIVILGFITIEAAYGARSDPWALAIVVSAYAAQVALICSVHAYHAAPPAWKVRIKVVAFALAVFLILICDYKASSMLPFGFAAFIWFISGVFTTVGFYCAFLMEGMVTGN